MYIYMYHIIGHKSWLKFACSNMALISALSPECHLFASLSGTFKAPLAFLENKRFSLLSAAALETGSAGCCTVSREAT